MKGINLERIVGVVLLKFLRMLSSTNYVRSGIIFFHPGSACREHSVKSITTRFFINTFVILYLRDNDIKSRSRVAVSLQRKANIGRAEPRYQDAKSI